MKSNITYAVFPARLLALAIALSTVALALFFVPTPSVRATPKATTWLVTSNGDGATNAANCPHVSNCRLRDAIAAAGVGDTINFSLTLPATITLTSGELNFSNRTLSGPGVSNLAISGNNSNRVFNTSGNSIIDGLTIRDGDEFGSIGGGIFNSGALTLTNSLVISNTAHSGGGIYSSGSLSIRNTNIARNKDHGAGGGISNVFPGIAILDIVTIDGNTSCDNACVGGAGGGIYNTGMMTITRGTISNNHLLGGSNGGGINNSSGGILTLNNVTVSGNTANEGAGISTAGSFSPTTNLNNVTITGNAAGTGGPGGLDVTGVPGNITNFQNTIVSGNTASFGADCGGTGTFNSQDYNLIGDSTGCTISGATIHNVGGNPKLTPLAWLGGPTQVHGLLSGSPALNAGNNATCLATDQRGIVRPLTGGNACDIGAFEGIATALYLPLIVR